MFVSRQRPGPTTRSPTVRNFERSSRRRVNAVIASPILGTRFNRGLRWLPGTPAGAFLPVATRSHNHRTTGEKVDVSGELPRLMNDDDPLAVPRIADFDLTAFHDVQIDIRLTGPKDRLAVRVLAARRPGA